MKRVLHKLNDKLPEKTSKQLKSAQIKTEVKLLKQSDPDKGLKKEFESASLLDLQKYLDD
jgi:hypothetical protein